MQPARRQDALRLLHTARPDMRCALNTEALCHSVSNTIDDYWDNVRRSAFNLQSNPNIGAEVVISPDSVLTEGTLVGHIETERISREERFARMLQDKYEALDDITFQSVAKCRKCGSKDISWQEKQTRSADEGCTVFVTCNDCHHRWVIR